MEINLCFTFPNKFVGLKHLDRESTYHLRTKTKTACTSSNVVVSLRASESIAAPHLFDASAPDSEMAIERS